MPRRAPRICSCGKVVASGARCACQAKRDFIRKAQHDAKRPNAGQRGYDADWRKLRAQHLLTQPYCVRCGALATVVDHIVSVRRAPHRRLDPANLQSLCISHHSGAKQSEERRARKEWP